MTAALNDQLAGKADQPSLPGRGTPPETPNPQA